MEKIFVKLLNMSISAGILILAVIVLRLLLRRAPKWIRCVLWAFVAVRLICPFHFSSPFSVYQFTAPPIRQGEAIEYVHYSNTPEKPRVVLDRSDYGISGDETGGAGKGTHKPDIYLPPIILIWEAGMCMFLFYAVFSTIKLKRQIREAVHFQDNIWLSDAARTPFIVGIIKPRIYLNFDMDRLDDQRFFNRKICSDSKKTNKGSLFFVSKNFCGCGDYKYVIAHEQAHIKRRDHWWKPLGYLLLSIYWFQPLCMIAYILFCRDLELACDEKAVKGLDFEEKKAYSNALVSCSMQRKMIIAYPLAFGEVSVRERVRAVLQDKKPAFWIIILSVVICIVTAVCFLTDPKGKAAENIGLPDHSLTEDGIHFYQPPETDDFEGEGYERVIETVLPDTDTKEEKEAEEKGTEIITDIDEAVSRAILDEENNKYYSGECKGEGHIILGSEKKTVNGTDMLTVYALTMYGEYEFQDGNFVKVSGRGSLPTVLTYRIDENGGYILEDYQTIDSKDFADSAQELFPKKYWDDCIAPKEEQIEELERQEQAYAAAYLKEIR